MRTIIRDNYTPKAGDYHERIVRDEVNNRQWIFDCDGVFTDITDTNTEIEIVNELGSSTTAVTSQKLVTDNVGILQEKIDELKNSPDVVDIVATYEDLMDYDTSSLGDKDVIRVLVDETHDNESSYYRWDKTNSQWVFIGAVEGYYTKAQTDDLLDEKQDTLTAGSNIQISGSTISATDTTYTAGNGLDLTGTTFSADTTVLATQADLATKQGTLTAGANISIDSNNVISATNTTYSDFVGTDGTTAGAAGLVPAPATTDAGKFLKADGTWDTAGSAVNVVQTTGTSTTDVMSQNAVTSMVFADPATLSRIKIGSGDSYGRPGVTLFGDIQQNASGIAIGRSQTNRSQIGGNGRARDGVAIGGSVGAGDYSVAVGHNAHTWVTGATGSSYVSAYNSAFGSTAKSSGQYGTAIGGLSIAGAASTGGNSEYNTAVGYSAKASANNGTNSRNGTTAVGALAWASANYSVALGSYSKATTKGQIDISTLATTNTYGYNDSQYRLLTGLYDPQSAHDAATKGYVDTAVAGAGGANTISSQDWSDLWQ